MFSTQLIFWGLSSVLHILFRWIITHIVILLLQGQNIWFWDVSKSESCSVESDCLRPYGLYSLWNSPGQNIGVGSLSLLQGIFPTQGWIPGFSHCRQILYHLSYQGNPRILGWVAYHFSRGSFRPRNQTEVSCFAGGFFTSWATREPILGITLCNMPPKPLTLLLTFCNDSNSDLNIQIASIGDWNKD